MEGISREIPAYSSEAPISGPVSGDGGRSAGPLQPDSDVLTEGALTPDLRLATPSAADLADELSFADPDLASPGSEHLQSGLKTWKEKLFKQFEEVNKELWLILSMFAIAGVMNYMVSSQRMLLGLYFLPTIFSAYCYGRRHAALTALASILLVGYLAYFNPQLLAEENTMAVPGGKWFEIITWGCILIITAYTMGSLYEKNKSKIVELRKTYNGLIVILRHFISKDKYTENHCYRVSIYATKIASYLDLTIDRIEDIRAASMLHDLGKLEISRELLYKAAQLTQEEFATIKKHVATGVHLLETLNSPLGRILPIVLAHHEKYDGSGYYRAQGEAIPLEARIISVADVYDALVSDRPYRKAMSPFEAKDIIEKGAGSDFDPLVVKGFLRAFRAGEMDVPNVMV